MATIRAGNRQRFWIRHAYQPFSGHSKKKSCINRFKKTRAIDASITDTIFNEGLFAI
jgi:hypothetical protein